jgi:hypothetical protein
MMYEDLGPVRRFRELANKYYKELERELGNEKPEPLYDPNAAVGVTNRDLER